VLSWRHLVVGGFDVEPHLLERQDGHPAPAAVGQPVTQEIARTVKGGRAECSVNGTVVAGRKGPPYEGALLRRRPRGRGVTLRAG
jgi:hypothetical protein